MKSLIFRLCLLSFCVLGVISAPVAAQVSLYTSSKGEPATSEQALADAIRSASEAGASVYSASELASNELPGLDVSLRGAVSIARRVQDPLAELVKIDPKSIGVGQYQHDVNQSRLSRKLDAVVEDCVNAVGVDVNTASPSLLARVSGLSRSQADNIVAFRDANGPFGDRTRLKAVPRLGDKRISLPGTEAWRSRTVSIWRVARTWSPESSSMHGV